MVPGRSFAQSVAFGVLHSTYTCGEFFAETFDIQVAVDIVLEVYIISEALQLTGLRAFVTVFICASE